MTDFFDKYNAFYQAEYAIDEKMIEFGLSWERNSYDDYDASIEFYGVAPDNRLSQEAKEYLKGLGFSRCWLNHKDNMETYYDLWNNSEESRRKSPEHRKYTKEEIKTIDKDMAEGALQAIQELLDSGGIPRGTFADDQVRNLVVMYNQAVDLVREAVAALWFVQHRDSRWHGDEIVTPFLNKSSDWLKGKQ